jgi:hypothetical protein
MSSSPSLSGYNLKPLAILFEVTCLKLMYVHNAKEISYLQVSSNEDDDLRCLLEKLYGDRN